jgi:hypothetical protein
MIELSNNLRFVANFRYELKQTVGPDPLELDVEMLEKLIPGTSDETAKKQFNSICD